MYTESNTITGLKWRAKFILFDNKVICIYLENPNPDKMRQHPGSGSNSII